MSKIEVVHPSRHFRGSPMIPGDKSISHRSLILGALANGKTEVTGILESEDIHSTARCLRQMGVKITHSGDKTFVEGIGEQGFSSPYGILDCGNSGTTIRLLMGVLAGQNIQANLTGDASLVRRPMRRVAEPLQQMGAKITLTHGDYAPCTVYGGPLRSISYELKVASAQIKTAILLSALRAEGTTRLSGQIQSRDHTERMLSHFGVELDVGQRQILIQGRQALQAAQVHVPGDPSTAAFWMAAASLIPRASLRVENVSLNPTRLGFLRALSRMGANVQSELLKEVPEPFGRVEVTHRDLQGICVTKDEVPSLIDEIPLLAVLATQAHGTTLIEGAGELRVKESDRIEAVVSNLKCMGVEIETQNDTLRIEGPQQLRGAQIQSFHDHRIAMAFSIAGLVAEGSTEIQNADCVRISYPNFFSTLRELTQ
jgi:3-phosphoshikimate 1-carboxyvinyltransferase